MVQCGLFSNFGALHIARSSVMHELPNFPPFRDPKAEDCALHTHAELQL